MSALTLVATLYFFVLAASPVIPIEVLIAAAFFLGTHGLANDYAPWAGAAFGLAIVVSTLTRHRRTLQNNRGREPDWADWPFAQPVGLLVGTFLAIMVASLAWTPLPETGMEKIADFGFRVVVPMWAMIYLGVRGQLNPRLVLALIWIGASAVSVFAVLVNLRTGLSLGGNSRLRVPGFHPLALGQICSVGLVLSLYAGRFIKINRLAQISMAVTSGLVLLLSASKGPLIAVVVGLGAGFLLDALRRLARDGLSFEPAIKWTAAGLFGFGLLAASGVNLKSLLPARLFPSYYLDPSGRTESVSSREQLWREAATRWTDDPLTGGGIASSYESEVRSIFSGEQLTIYPHNFLLEILGELGMFAGISILAIILTLFWRFRRDRLRITMLVLLIGNATVSGGIGDHRILIPLVAVALLAIPSKPEQSVNIAGPKFHNTSLSSTRRGPGQATRLRTT